MILELYCAASFNEYRAGKIYRVQFDAADVQSLIYWEHILNAGYMVHNSIDEALFAEGDADVLVRDGIGVACLSGSGVDGAPADGAAGSGAPEADGALAGAQLPGDSKPEVTRRGKGESGPAGDQRDVPSSGAGAGSADDGAD